MRILVLSTFDVWPPRDGGQNRYVNLWRNFPAEHEITILAYDFRNLTGERRYRLADHVEVIVPPASEGDARHFHHMQARTGLWLHDVLCLADYQFSSAFMHTLSAETASCDVLVASHPYLAELAFPLAPARILRVYEGHNVEFDIKAEYLHSSRDAIIARNLLDAVRRGEEFAARQADHITTVSEADRTRLSELYGLESKEISVVPNGATIRSTDLLGPEARREVRSALRVGDKLVGIFLGSNFAANVESYRRGRDMLEAAGFRGTLLLAGSIAEASRDDWSTVGFEERWLGFVSADVRDVLLATADFAFHLIFAGAGTNLKLFEYMGAGTAIIANNFGRRGIKHESWCLEVDSSEDLAMALNSVANDPSELSRIKATARYIAQAEFDWSNIADRFATSLSGAQVMT